MVSTFRNQSLPASAASPGNQRKSRPSYHKKVHEKIENISLTRFPQTGCLCAVLSIPHILNIGTSDDSVYRNSKSQLHCADDARTLFAANHHLTDRQSATRWSRILGPSGEVVRGGGKVFRKADEVFRHILRFSVATTRVSAAEARWCETEARCSVATWGGRSRQQGFLVRNKGVLQSNRLIAEQKTGLWPRETPFCLPISYSTHPTPTQN